MGDAPKVSVAKDNTGNMATKKSGNDSPLDEKVDQQVASSPSPSSSYLPQVIGLFVDGIPEDSKLKCTLISNPNVTYPSTGSPRDQEMHLHTFVAEKIDWISQFEYGSWLNGRMPFVTFRELQIWRLRQFAEHIWYWNVPDDDAIATIFNITKRRASNLVADFHARFGKIYILPKSLRRLLDILKSPTSSGDITVDSMVGDIFYIPSPRYINDLNALISELRRITGNKVLQDARKYKRNKNYMWVSRDVREQLFKPKYAEALKTIYPEETE